MIVPTPTETSARFRSLWYFANSLTAAQLAQVREELEREVALGWTPKVLPVWDSLHDAVLELRPSSESPT